MPHEKLNFSVEVSVSRQAKWEKRYSGNGVIMKEEINKLDYVFMISLWRHRDITQRAVKWWHLHLCWVKCGPIMTGGHKKIKWKKAYIEFNIDGSKNCIESRRLSMRGVYYYQYIEREKKYGEVQMCSNESDARDCAKLRLSSEISVGDSVKWMMDCKKKKKDRWFLPSSMRGFLKGRCEFL